MPCGRMRMQMGIRKKVVLKAETVTDFHRRVVDKARDLDRDQVPHERLTISFENPRDMLQVITVARLDLLRIVRDAPGPIGEIAERLRRDRRAISRDVDALEALGLVRTRMETNPGHGRRRVVMPEARRYELITEI